MRSIIKVFSKLSKNRLKIYLLIALGLSASNVSGQTFPKLLALKNYHGNFEIVKVDQRTIKISESINPMNDYVRQINTYTLDVLTVKHIKSGKEYKFLYPGDLTWDVGDKYHFNLKGHYTSDAKFTDHEIEEVFMPEVLGYAVNQHQEADYFAVIVAYKKLEN